MGDVVAFPDRPNANERFIPANEIGEWLYNIDFIESWIPDVLPPVEVMRGFIGAVCLHDGGTVEEVAQWISNETGWTVLL